MVDDGDGIEHHDIGGHAGREQPAIDQADCGRGQAGHLAHRVLPGEHLLLAHVAAEHPREGAVGARMGGIARACAAIAGHRRGWILQQLHEVSLDAEARDDARAPAFEQAHDRFARRHLQFAHHVGEVLLHRRQVDAAGAAEARGHRRLGLGHDARAQGRVGKALQHGLAAAVLRPTGNGERDQSGLPGEIRIHVGGGIGPTLGRLPHLAGDDVGAPLLVPLHLHVRDERRDAAARANRNGLGHAGQ